MPIIQRHKTKYPGVYWILGTGANGKPEKIYYIRYRKNGREFDEKAGRQYREDMTPARAAALRTERISGKLSNRERRDAEKARQKEQEDKWTIDRLWEEYKAQKSLLKGMTTDQNRYGNYIKPLFGDREPCELVPLDVDRLRINLLKKRKPGTVKNIVELLKRIVNFGANKGLCQGVSFKIQMPRVNNEKTEDLTPGQLENLLEAIKEDMHPQAGPIMLMALYTGMRRGELFRLEWKDLDFERGFIHIRGPKGGVDQTIPLNDGARQILESVAGTESEYVFPGRAGGRRTDIHHQVNRIRDKAGLPKDFRALHGLRHVYASMLASSGKVDLYTLQKLMTHKSPQMTQRYAHLRDETLRRASSLAGDIIKKAMDAKKEGEKIIKLKTSSS